jgi:hypothetical protein
MARVYLSGAKSGSTLITIRRRILRRELMGLFLWLGAIVVVYGTIPLPLPAQIAAAFVWLAGSGVIFIRISRKNLHDTEEVFEGSLNRVLRAHEDFVTRMAMYGEVRDGLTSEHLHRVREVSTLIAHEMGLAIEDARAIGKAAVAHDIGKIGIPDDVLGRPGKLSPEDHNVIKTHTEIGERMLGQSPLFELERQVARHHHERWDGRGYPNALTETNIPLVARVTAVADVFDVLVTKRAYKDAWTEAQAVSYLVEHAGSQFDPAAVQAFLRLLQRGEIRGHKLPEGVDLGEHHPSRAPRPRHRHPDKVQTIGGRRMRVVATSLELDDEEEDDLVTIDEGRFSR